MSSGPAPPSVPDISAQVQQYQQFLGEHPRSCAPHKHPSLPDFGQPPLTPRIPVDASRTLPEFPEINVQGKGLPEGAGPEDLRVFQQLYREHCEVGTPPDPKTAPCPHPGAPLTALCPTKAIVDVMINLQFSLVEMLWKSFWRCSGETDA